MSCQAANATLPHPQPPCPMAPSPLNHPQHPQQEQEREHTLLMPDPYLSPALVALGTPRREQGLLPGVKAAWAGAGREYGWVQVVGGQVQAVWEYRHCRDAGRRGWADAGRSSQMV